MNFAQRLSCGFAAKVVGFLTLVATAAANQAGVLDVPIKGDKAGPSATMVRVYEQSHALVVGIHNPGAAGVPSAIGDAQEVAATLKTLGFAVRPVMDPDGRQLAAAFETFLDGPGSSAAARLLIWFSGRVLMLDGKAILLPARKTGDRRSAADATHSLSIDRIARKLREAKARHVLGAFDACFNDAAIELVRGRPSATISRRTVEPARQIITSCDVNQEVAVGSRFRELFLDALTGRSRLADANKDNFLTATELGLFLADRISSLTENLQTPRFGTLKFAGLDRGNMLFRIPAAPLPRVVMHNPGEQRRPGSAGSVAPESLNETKLVEDIQRRLRALRCYSGRVDGKWGRNTILAIVRINQQRKGRRKLTSARPDPATLRQLQAIRKPVCPVVAKLPAEVKPGSPKAKPKRTSGKCPASALEASKRIWTPGSLPTGESATRRHRCGRRLTCVGGSNQNFQPRRCRWH